MHLEGQRFPMLLRLPMLQARPLLCNNRPRCYSATTVALSLQCCTSARQWRIHGLRASGDGRSYRIRWAAALRLGELLQLIHRAVKLVQIYCTIDPADLALVGVLPKHPALPAGRYDGSVGIGCYPERIARERRGDAELRLPE